MFRGIKSSIIRPQLEAQVDYQADEWTWAICLSKSLFDSNTHLLHGTINIICCGSGKVEKFENWRDSFACQEQFLHGGIGVVICCSY